MCALARREGIEVEVFSALKVVSCRDFVGIFGLFTVCCMRELS